MNVESRKRFIINITFLAIIVAIFYLFLKYAVGWIMPFIIALIIAFCIQRPVAWLSKKTKLKRKTMGAVISVITILLMLGVIFTALYFIVSEAVSFAKTLPELTANLMPQLSRRIESLSESAAGILPKGAEDFIHNFNTQLSQQLTSLVGRLAGSVTSWAASAAANIPGALLSFIITIIATIFISMDYRNIADFFLRQIPEHMQDTFASIKETFVNTILKFIKAYLILMGLMFIELLVLLGITHLITGKIPYLVIVCALIALVDMLPVLGTGTVLIPWSVISLIMGDWVMSICLILSYLIVIIVRNFLEPRIVGKSIGLHPLITLFSMYVGLKLLGFIGMLVLPLVVITLVKVQESGKIKIFK
ncbi:MAG: sporulation integral membrane protein YtvI [Clostridia bacterium]|nr:sporulation integral membrane protein YtvI [Clostridia bacterium]